MFHGFAQYTNRAAVSVRGALKEPAKSKLAAQGEFSYRLSLWQNGIQGAKEEVHSLSQAGRAA